MREIKFRAWDFETKCFRDIQYIEFWEGGMRIALWDGLTVEVRENGEGLALMQYTGLKDKNGKEIYEGDIAIIEKNGRGVVIYDVSNSQFTFESATKNIHRSVGLFCNDSEIIGNIYETPELLK